MKRSSVFELQKDEIEYLTKMRRMTFALATKKGLRGKFVDEALHEYCYNIFGVRTKLDLTPEQLQKLYQTLRYDDDVVNGIKLKGKLFEVEDLIKNIVNADGYLTREDVVRHLLTQSNLNSIEDAGIFSLENWIKKLRGITKKIENRAGRSSSSAKKIPSHAP